MTQGNTQFNQMSPVVEMILILLVKMREYLEIYGSDINAKDLSEFQTTVQALEDAIEKIGSIFQLPKQTLLANMNLMQQFTQQLKNQQTQDTQTQTVTTSSEPTTQLQQEQAEAESPQTTTAPSTTSEITADIQQPAETTTPHLQETAQDIQTQAQPHPQPGETTSSQEPQLLKEPKNSEEESQETGSDPNVQELLKQLEELQQKN